jgi:hypothetical protein
MAAPTTAGTIPSAKMAMKSNVNKLSINSPAARSSPPKEVLDTPIS